MLVELRMRPTISHVTLRRGIGVQRSERRRENRIENAPRWQVARQVHGIAKLHFPSLAFFDARCIGHSAASRAAVNLTLVQFVHIVHHLLVPFRGVALFALDVLGYGAFVGTRHDVAVYLLLLAEAPTTAHRLVKIFITI